VSGKRPRRDHGDRRAHRPGDYESWYAEFHGEGDFAQGSTKAFHDRLTVEHERFELYREPDGSGGHCEGMGPARGYADVFVWLDDLWPA
jgi:hypothetical protein